MHTSEINPNIPVESFIISTDSPIKRTSRAIATVSLFVLMALALVSVASATFILVRHIHFERVLSDSMVPAYKRGDVLLVKPVPAHSLRTGDIAVLPLIKEPGNQYAHRIISVESNGKYVQVETKGDANAVMDPWKLTITSPEVPVVVSQIPASIVPIVSLNRYVLIGLFLILCLLFISVLSPGKRVSQETRPSELE